MPTTAPGKLSLIGFVFLALSLGAFSPAQDVDPVAEPDAARGRAKAVIASVSPAIVRFAYGKERKLQFGCGVIVSAEGHVAISGPVHAVLDDDLLDLRLTSGRRVRGKALGWSSEFGFGLLKITDPGPWPHVDISKRGKPGAVCIALGYPRDSAAEFPDGRPDLRLGVITLHAPGQWLTTSYRSEFGAHGVFDLDGKLLGLNCSTPVGGDPIHASAELITAHWDALVAGKNLDRVRLFPEAPRVQGVAEAKPATEKIAPSVMARAKAASVRISEIDARESLASGVIVTPDGYVVTCGHHERMPGKKLKLSLTDGRDVDAIVLSTNLVADVGVLKITDKGPWPHAELGDSSRMDPGSSCVLIGYPRTKPGREPWIHETLIIKPTQTNPRKDEWYRRFWTAGYPKSIGGASGGGVFDSRGRVIGVLVGGAGQEMQHSRVELFRKNWDLMTANQSVQAVDPKLAARTSAALDRIAEELSARDRPGTKSR